MRARTISEKDADKMEDDFVSGLRRADVTKILGHEYIVAITLRRFIEAMIEARQEEDRREHMNYNKEQS